ncbi:MAG: TetR family transcriptional regulator C-terminal domain-containing protein [Maritimibacter sp.]
MNENHQIGGKRLSQRETRAQNRARILASAEKVFAEYGYTGGSISRIAAEAGIPKSNVIYYFANKEALYHEVVGDIFNIWRAAADQISDRSDPIAALSDYIDTKLDLARARPYGSKVWANEIIQGAPIAQDYLETELRSWTDDRIAVIDGWIEAGKLRPVSARHLLYAIWSTTQHYADFGHQIATLNDGKPFSDAQWEETKVAVKELLLGGLIVEVSPE